MVIDVCVVWKMYTMSHILSNTHHSKICIQKEDDTRHPRMKNECIKKCPSYWKGKTVPMGFEPTLSCVTGRRVNRYTTGPKLNGDSYGTRTRVTAVKGRCLNRLTKEPVSSTEFIIATVQ